MYGSGDEKRYLSWIYRFGNYQHIDHDWKYKSRWVCTVGQGKSILWGEGGGSITEHCGQSLRHRVLTLPVYLNHPGSFSKYNSWAPHSRNCDSVIPRYILRYTMLEKLHDDSSAHPHLRSIDIKVRQKTKRVRRRLIRSGWWIGGKLLVSPRQRSFKKINV